MFSPDLPITRSTEDVLNRGTFAKSLAKTLLQYDQPFSFTIGLYGEWGSGKTSLLNMILENVESGNDSAVILRFNPWLCSEPRQLITQFFKQMAATIKLKKPAGEKVWELIDQYAGILDAVNVLSMGELAGTILSTAGKALASEAEKRTEQRSGNLQESKDRIIEKLLKDRLKLIVAIDDIDRLSEEEIIAVFQLVKSLADFPNMIYLLAFDYDVVVRALGKVQHGNGKDYLEKIVQVPFEIPAPSMENIHEELFAKLNTILADIPEERLDKAVWAELFHFGMRNYMKSIRDVIRYTNVFFLKYELLKDETDLVDLLGLTCLQVFEPTLYSKLYNYKDTLCGGDNSYFYGRQKADEEKVKRTISDLFSNNGDISDMESAKNILAILFPRTRTAVELTYGIGRSYIYENLFANHNIAVSACFDRYFALSLENNAIPTSVVRYLIYEADEEHFVEGVQQIYREGKIVRLMEELQTYARKNAPDISADRAELIIRNLSRSWNSFQIDERDEGGFFFASFEWRLPNYVQVLLNVMPSSLQFACIRSLFEDIDVQLSTLALMLYHFENNWKNRSAENTGDSTNARKEAVFSMNEISELEQIFKNRAVEALNSKDALEQCCGAYFWTVLERIDLELAAEKKKAVVTDDISLVKLLDCCVSRGTAEMRTVIKTRGVKKKKLVEFIDIDEAYQRIKSFSASEEFFRLAQNEQMNAVAFLLLEEKEKSESDEDSWYDWIAEDVIIRELEKKKEFVLRNRIIDEKRV